MYNSSTNLFCESHYVSLQVTMRDDSIEPIQFEGVLFISKLLTASSKDENVVLSMASSIFSLVTKLCSAVPLVFTILYAYCSVCSWCSSGNWKVTV